ncbi:hypothetical protein DRO32_03175 [Candidatus Bathyarchaeota archaeon]|nr:MAG: hypothetical protein DRO32_03175 [Candidatus Bathyarchaeota archaeon]
MGHGKPVLAGRKKALVELLQQDGRMSFTELGRRLGISHVGARKHLKKLLSSGLITIRASLNPDKLGARLLVLLCEVEHDELVKIKRVFQECPRMAFLATMIGPYNLMAIMVAEAPGLVKIMALGACCLRRMEGIRRSELYVVEDLLYPEGLPIRVRAEKKAELTPCGLSCGTCDFYTRGECPACPATRWYKGPL